VASSPSSIEAFIQGIPLFCGVAREEASEVLRLLTPVSLEVGEVLFREGEPGRAMWVLAGSAEVTVSTLDAAQRRVEVGYLRTGDVLGEMALVDDGLRSGTAMVTCSGEAYRVDATAFHAMRDTWTPVVFKILRQIALSLCLRLRQTNERITAATVPGPATPAVPDGRRPDPALLDRFPAFRPFPALVKLALAQQLEVLELDEATTVFREWDPAAGAYFIVEGAVEVVRNGTTLAVLSAGATFGIVACIDSGVRSATCRTQGRATLLRMSNPDFERLFESGHRFAFRVVDLIAQQLVTHVRNANRMVRAAPDFELETIPIVLGEVNTQPAG
jgi:CRP-like cAMP-binding protein